MPNVIILAGANGSGKTTASTSLRDELELEDFVNADAIAQGLSAYNPESVAMEAARLMLKRLKELAAARANFAFETTLASRTFAPWLKGLIAEGYKLRICFLWTPSPQMNVIRVASRVLAGGHHVPDDTVQRRHSAGLRNFFEL